MNTKDKKSKTSKILPRFFGFKKYSEKDLENAVPASIPETPAKELWIKSNMSMSKIHDQGQRNIAAMNTKHKKSEISKTPPWVFGYEKYSGSVHNNAVEASIPGTSANALWTKCERPMSTFHDQRQRNIAAMNTKDIKSEISKTHPSSFGYKQYSGSNLGNSVEASIPGLSASKLPIKPKAIIYAQRQRNIATMNTKDMKSEISTPQPSSFGYKKYSGSNLGSALEASTPGVSANKLPIKSNLPKAIIYAQRQQNIATMNTKDMKSEISATQPSSFGYKKYSGSNLGSALQASTPDVSANKLPIKSNLPKTIIYAQRQRNIATMNTKDMKSENNKTQPIFSGYKKYSASVVDDAVQTSIPVKYANELSIKSDIPKPTIHYQRQKNIRTMNADSIKADKPYMRSEPYKLTKFGELDNDHVERFPRRMEFNKYAMNDLDNAVKAYKSGTSFSEASRIYNVPRISIYDQLRNLDKTKRIETLV